MVPGDVLFQQHIGHLIGRQRGGPSALDQRQSHPALPRCGTRMPGSQSLAKHVGYRVLELPAVRHGAQLDVAHKIVGLWLYPTASIVTTAL